MQVEESCMWWFDFYSEQKNTALSLFNNLKIDNNTEEIQSKEILFLGDGPFPSDDLAEFISERGIIKSAGNCNFENPCSAKYIIIGGDIHSSELTDYIGDIFESLELAFDEGITSTKVYTQVMFLLENLHGFSIWNNKELLDLISDKDMIINELTKGLESENIFFDWKTFKIGKSGNGGAGRPNLPQKSPLSAMGYSASKASGYSSAYRRNILRKCLSSHLDFLPFCQSEGYMLQWGNADSCKRLIRLAKQVAYCPPNTSIETESVKQSDLNYLKEKFYSNLCNNQIWPTLSTTI